MNEQMIENALYETIDSLKDKIANDKTLENAIQSLWERADRQEKAIEKLTEQIETLKFDNDLDEYDDIGLSDDDHRSNAWN